MIRLGISILAASALVGIAVGKWLAYVFAEIETEVDR